MFGSLGIWHLASGRSLRRLVHASPLPSPARPRPTLRISFPSGTRSAGLHFHGRSPTHLLGRSRYRYMMIAIVSSGQNSRRSSRIFLGMSMRRGSSGCTLQRTGSCPSWASSNRHTMQYVSCYLRESQEGIPLGFHRMSCVNNARSLELNIYMFMNL